MLIDYKADPNAKDKTGVIVLDLAIRLKNEKIIKILLKAGANPELIKFG